MSQGQIQPFVTAMIVVRNEERYIGAAVTSFLEQNYPKESFELLIIDGNSEDGTVQSAKHAVEIYEKEHGTVQVRYLKNPKRLLASGWNIGIKAAKGEYVVRIDAHAQADPDLIRRCVQILNDKPDVVCAGGRIATETLTEKGKLIADVLSSPFGVGNARFRYAEESGYVDTVAYGVYRKSIFEKAGYFNEEFMRNQDNDMHGRIKRCGGKFYLETSVTSTYHARENVKGMMKQAFGNGKWGIIGWKKSESREGISLRHMIPLFFVLVNFFLIAAGVLCEIFRWMLLAMYLLYFGAAVYFALKKTKNIGRVLRMCGCYWILHVSYGAGALAEIFGIKGKEIRYECDSVIGKKAN